MTVIDVGAAAHIIVLSRVIDSQRVKTILREPERDNIDNAKRRARD